MFPVVEYIWPFWLLSLHPWSSAQCFKNSRCTTAPENRLKPRLKGKALRTASLSFMCFVLGSGLHVVCRLNIDCKPLRNCQNPNSVYGEAACRDQILSFCPVKNQEQDSHGTAVYQNSMSCSFKVLSDKYEVGILITHYVHDFQVYLGGSVSCIYYP